MYITSLPLTVNNVPDPSLCQTNGNNLFCGHGCGALKTVMDMILSSLCYQVKKGKKGNAGNEVANVEPVYSLILLL